MHLRPSAHPPASRDLDGRVPSPLVIVDSFLVSAEPPTTGDIVGFPGGARRVQVRRAGSTVRVYDLAIEHPLRPDEVREVQDLVRAAEAASAR